MNWQLAQLNIARRRFALDGVEMKDFVDGLDPVNALADQSDGFIWRLQTDAGDATELSIYGDPELIVNITVWESLDALLSFVRSAGHLAIMKRRREWFERMEAPHLVLWWVPTGHQPTIEEAEQRLDHLREHGSTAQAFSARDDHPAPAESDG